MGQLGDQAVALLFWLRDDANYWPHKRRAFRTGKAKRVSQKGYAQGQAAQLKHPSICEKCADVAKTQAHHWTYTRPLDVIFLCHACHMGLHAMMRNPGQRIRQMKRHDNTAQSSAHNVIRYDIHELGELY